MNPWYCCPLIGCWRSMAITEVDGKPVVMVCADHPTPAEIQRAEALERARLPIMADLRAWAEARGWKP